jgi:glycosyltransferase involved in cell wall biosynthesis
LQSNPIPKILHIITRLDMGGSAQNTLLTCLELSGRYDMVLAHGLSRESNMTDSEAKVVYDGVQRATQCGVRFVSVPSLVRRIHPWKDLCALLGLWLTIRREKPSIVHTHTSKAGILGRFAACLAGAPIIVHTPHGHVFYGHFGRCMSRVFRYLERWFAYFTNKLIALTEGERKDYISLKVCPPQKIHTIHSGVDIPRFQIPSFDVHEKKRQLGLDRRQVLVGFVGWLLAVKGPMHLLNAMDEVRRRHPEAVLVFLGKGELEQELKAKAEKLGMSDCTVFLGWREDLAEIMQLLDILVLPSLNEGMGRVLVEAMAAAKPIVASLTGGIPDLVRHNETGLLVPPGNEAALSESIQWLIENPEDARLMGLKGRQRCEQFSLQAMIDKLDALYRDLLGDGRGGRGQEVVSSDCRSRGGVVRRAGKGSDAAGISGK